MSIPDYQAIMLPLLELASDLEVHQFRSAVDFLAHKFQLTEDEKRELLPSGRQPRSQNRVGWARTYMTKARLLESPMRGTFRITERGQQVLNQTPSSITSKYLEQFPEFITFRSTSYGESSSDDTRPNTIDARIQNDTPEESLETAYRAIREDLGLMLLEGVKSCSPDFFEQLVVDLLVGMGYGGSRQEAGKAVGRSGDEGIDGIINEDRLGLDVIYIQAKRWKDVVGRPEIQKFAGALQGQRARKGVFITTSSFSSSAIEFVAGIDTKIRLIDGIELSGLMIDHGVGVTTTVVYELKRIDSDYFLEE